MRPPEDQSQGVRHDRTENTGNRSQLPVTPWFASRRQWRSARSLLVFAPDGRLVTAGEDGTARVWDLKQPQAQPLVLRGHEGLITALVFAPDGRLVTAGEDGTARVWDLKQPQ